MDEKTFFEQGIVRVTSSRFIVGSQTYTMNGVTSVKSSEIPPSRTGPIVVILVGLLILAAAEGIVKVLGVAIIALGIWLFTQQRTTKAVVLSSASGEVQALSDQMDASVDIPGVVHALNEAIVHRG